jgi:histone-lysine N-methyltransferase SETMAR
MLKSQIKTMIIITLFDIKGIIHFEYILQGKTVNRTYFMIILKWLCEAVCRRRPELRPSDWILYHDNTPAHKVLYVKQFLAQKLITEMEHPPFSPCLASNVFWLFPGVKYALKAQCFEDIEDIQKKCDDSIDSYSTTGVPKCFQQWQHLWAKCIAAQGEYFEGDPSQLAVSIQE